MSLKLKFLSQFTKLHNQTRAKLVAVELTHTSALPKEFFEYDTAVESGPEFTVPTGTIVVLTFSGDKRIPFATVRRSNKYDYYNANIGQWFDIVVEAEKAEENKTVEQTSIDLNPGENHVDSATIG